MHYASFAVLLAAVLIGVPFLDQSTRAVPDTTAETSQTRAAEQDAYAPRSVVVSADGRGHFTVQAQVNGRSIDMLADTGASAVVLTAQDARRAGFNPGALDYSVAVSTANGTAHVAAVKIDRMEVDGIALRDVTAFVAEPEALGRSLLGMSFIGRLARFSMEGERLILVE
jgi:aspartyl protease family protein